MLLVFNASAYVYGLLAEEEKKKGKEREEKRKRKEKEKERKERRKREKRLAVQAALSHRAQRPCPPRKVGRPSPLQGWADRGRPKRNW